jgi:itaconyl-CoA hydratase
MTEHPSGTRSAEDAEAVAPVFIADEPWLEAFAVGQKIRHARGATIGEFENQSLTKLVMNTSEAHWNEDRMSENTILGKGRVVFGLFTASLVIGLTSEDTSLHAERELDLQNVRFPAPVHHGDTLYAFTEVTEVENISERQNAGVVGFHHWGVGAGGTVVFEADRHILVQSMRMAGSA